MRARTLLLVGGLGVALGLVVAAGWDLHRVRADVATGRRALTDLTLEAAADRGLVASVDLASARFDRAARRAGDSPTLSLLSHLPVVGEQIAGVREMTASTAEVGRAAAASARRVAEALDGAGRPAGRLRLLEVVDREAARLEASLEDVDLGAPGELLGPARRAHDDLQESIRSARARLEETRRAMEPIRALLEGPSSYLLLAANNAEMAGGAGLALSAGVLTFDEGAIELGAVVPARDLRLDRGVEIPQALRRIYSPTGMGIDLRSTTRSPDLTATGPVALELMAAHGVTGLSGVVVVDALALRQLLAVTGGVDVRNLHVDEANVLETVLHDTYRYFDRTGDRADRDALQGDIARAVMTALTTRDAPALELAGALLDAARGRHLMLWSADAEAQRVWEDLAVAGALPPDGLLISFQNHDASKMDWYLRPSVALDGRTLPSGDHRLRLRMSLPVPEVGAVPDASPYVLGPDPTVHGLFLTVHLPAAARDITTTDPTGFRTQGVEQRLHVRTFRADVPAGQTFERTVELTLPRGVTSLTLLPSARVEPMVVDVDGMRAVDDATSTRVALPGAGARQGMPLWERAALVAVTAFALSLIVSTLRAGTGSRRPRPGDPPGGRGRAAFARRREAPADAAAPRQPASGTGQASVMAPRSAPEASRAYLARTPVV